MKIICISLSERNDLRDKHSHLIEYFKDDFSFYIESKIIKSLEEINELVKNNIISINYNGGRKKISALTGELDCFYKHLNILSTIKEPTIILEDGSIFDIDKFKLNSFDDYEFVLCDEAWKMENNKLVGHNINYYVTPNGAKKILSMCHQLPIPLDLHIRNQINEIGGIKYKIADVPFIRRNTDVKHSTQEYTDSDNLDVNSKQCFRPLIERIYTLKKQKLAIIASHPTLGTGYANIATQIANNFCKYFDVIYLGFQSCHKSVQRFVNTSVKVFDLFDLDKESPGGFGDKAILPILQSEKPDIVMIYNDIGVISAVLHIIKEYSCLKTIYIDMVYEFQNFDILTSILEKVDYVFTFCDFWKSYLETIFNYKKAYVLYHGLKKFDESKLLSRAHFNFKDNQFIILNLNRNSNRKNIDITIRAFLIMLKKLLDKKENVTDIFLQLNCHVCTTEGINIPNVILSELLRMDLPPEFGKQVILNQGGHLLSELEIHSLYNICDIGLSTSSGEGFGLTLIEHAQYNKQIVSTHIPTVKELLDTPYLINPIDIGYDCGNISGMKYLFNSEMVADTLLDAYNNRFTPKLCKIKNIENFNWDKISSDFYNFIY